MASHPVAPARSHTTPKDFFLWLGAILSLYGSITAFFTLIFDYVNLAFPDPLAYADDPFGTSVRVSMATLVVLIPVMLATLLAIRRDIVRTPGKASIWVRRWALVFTIFLASATAAITLITLITTFLGGEITVRFALKALVVFLIAILAALHFLADLRGYWTLHRRKVNMVGAAVGALAIMTIIGGFLMIGSPSHIRDLRQDQQRVNDLQAIQYDITNYWQEKRTLPPSLETLNDPLIGQRVPVDPQTNAPYEYTPGTGTSFTLCATFSAPSTSSGNQYESTITHGAGRTCVNRTIDPDKYPPLGTPAALAQ